MPRGFPAMGEPFGYVPVASTPAAFAEFLKLKRQSAKARIEALHLKLD